MSNLSLAMKIIRDLSPLSKKINIAGSLRRGIQSTKDIDILLLPKDKESLDKIREYCSTGKVERKGEQIISFYKEGIPIDLYISEEENYGAMLLFLTGSNGYNIGLRCVARRQGKILNRYGLFDRESKQLLASKTEEDIYDNLGKVWKEPILRGK